MKLLHRKLATASAEEPLTVVKLNQVIEVRPDGTEVFRLTLPITYPLDAQQLPNSNLLIDDYVQHGRVIEITPSGQVVWDYYFPRTV